MELSGARTARTDGGTTAGRPHACKAHTVGRSESHAIAGTMLVWILKRGSDGIELTRG
jgi:hypothetical protein